MEMKQKIYHADLCMNLPLKLQYSAELVNHTVMCHKYFWHLDILSSYIPMMIFHTTDSSAFNAAHWLFNMRRTIPQCLYERLQTDVSCYH